MSLLLTDPIWIRIQERLRLLARIALTGHKDKHGRAGMIGPGPNGLDDMIALLDPPWSNFSQDAVH